MKAIIGVIVLLCGLLGCVSRRSAYSEKVAVGSDSLNAVRTDSLLMRHTRRVQAGGQSHWRQVVFSEPDSAGRQYIREVAYRAEEWGAADTSQVIAFRKEQENIQVVQQKTWTEKRVTEKKHLWGGRIGAGIVFVFVIFVFLCIKYVGYGRRTRNGAPYGGSGEEV